MNLVALHTPLELCDRGEYETAAELAGLRVGEWPENVSGGNLTQAERLLVAGWITSRTGKIQTDAEKMLLESIRLFGDNPRVWIARLHLAWAEYWDGNYDAALSLAGRILESKADSPTRFMAFLLRSTMYWHEGLTNNAWIELEQMESLYDQCSAPLKGKFHNQRAVILRKLGETDRAIVEYDCAIQFFEGNLRWQAVAINNLAGVYLEAEQFSEAHKYADQARELFTALGDSNNLASALDQTAQIYLAEAMSVSGKTLSEYQETDEKIKHIHVIQSQNDRYTPPPAPHPAPHLKPIPPAPGERSTAMTQLEKALSLIETPEHALAFWELFVWARGNRDDPAHEALVDEVEDFVHSKTEMCARHRETDKKSLLLQLVPPATADS